MNVEKIIYSLLPLAYILVLTTAIDPRQRLLRGVRVLSSLSTRFALNIALSDFATGFIFFLTFILKKLFYKYIKFSSKSLYSILGVFHQLFAILNLCFEQLSKFLVIIFKLFAFQSFLEDILSIVSDILSVGSVLL